MPKIQIVADSTCDLSPELKERFHIITIPLCIVLDDKSYYDGEEITPPEIYEWSDAHRTTPKTAAVSYERALDILKPLMDAGDEIICFTISAQMSTTCNVFRLIAAFWPKSFCDLSLATMLAFEQVSVINYF